MNAEKYYMYLLCGEDIPFENVKIHQPTLREIMKVMTIQTYDALIQPFMLTVEYFHGKASDKLFSKYLLCDKHLLTYMITAIQMMIPYKEVKALFHRLAFTFNDANENEVCFVLDDDNFDEFCDIVLLVNAKKRVVVEKVPDKILQIKDPEKRRYWLETWTTTQRGRQKFNKENSLHLWDALNVCQFCGEYIPIDEMMDWTLWRVMNCYNAKLGLKSYDDNLSMALVSGDTERINGDYHWYKQLTLKDSGIN